MPVLPPPPVSAEVDLRDMPIPREFFARLAVETFGISYELARAFADEKADQIEKGRSRKQGKRRRA